MNAVPAGGRRSNWLAGIAVFVAVIGTVTVVIAAFALTFDASREVAQAARIAARLAWLLPVSVDGAMMVATVDLMVMRKLGGGTRYPAVVVMFGGLISIACNGLHAVSVRGGRVELGSVERFLISAIPALMLLLSVHLLAELIGALAARPEAAPGVAERPRKPRQPATPAGAPATTVSAVVAPGAAAPVAPVELAPPARRRARAADPVDQAEQLTKVAGLADELGRRPKRQEVKDLLKISSARADELLRALDVSAQV